MNRLCRLAACLGLSLWIAGCGETAPPVKPTAPPAQTQAQMEGSMGSPEMDKLKAKITKEAAEKEKDNDGNAEAEPGNDSQDDEKEGE